MVKVKVQCSIQNARARTTAAQGASASVESVEYDISANLPLDSHLSNIVQALKAMGYPITEDTSNYCLEGANGKLFEYTSPLQDQMNEQPQKLVILKAKPKIRAEKAINDLRSQANLKEVLFFLRDDLQDSNFTAEFIECGGMPALLNLVSQTTGTTQSYALTAMRSTLSFITGMRVLLNTPGLIKQLYLLVDSPVVAVCRQALELLFVTCTFDAIGAEKIHAAAKATSEELGRPLYQNLVNLLESGDLDTQINSLTFINSILQTSAGEEARKETLDALNQINFTQILKKHANIEHQAFKRQLQFLENITGITIQDQSNEDMRNLLREYQMQQPMIRTLRDELRRAQAIIKESVSFSNFLPSASVAPLQRYSERESEFDTLNDVRVVPIAQTPRTARGPKADDDREVRQLKSQVQGLLSKLDTVQSSYDQLKTKSSQWKQDSKALKKLNDNKQSGDSSSSSSSSSPSKSSGDDKREKELKALREELNNQSTELAQMADDLQAASENVEKERLELEEEKKKLAQERAKLGGLDLDKELFRLQKMSEEVIRASEELVLERDAMEKERSLLQEKIAANKSQESEINRLQQELDEAKRKIQQEQQEKQAIRQEQMHSEDLKQLNQKTQAEIAVLNEEIASLQQKVTFRDSQLAHEKQLKEEAESNINKVNKVLNLMKLRFEAINAQFQHEQQQSQNLTQQIQKLQQEITSLQEKVHQQEAQLQAQESSSSSHQQRDLSSAPAPSSASVEPSRAQYEKMYNEFYSFYEPKNHIIFETDSRLEISISEVTRPASSASSRLAPLSPASEQHLTQMSSLQVELLTCELDVQRTENEHYKAEIEGQQEEINKLNKQIETLRATVEKLNHKVKGDLSALEVDDDDEEIVEVQTSSSQAIVPTKPPVQVNAIMKPLVWERIVLQPPNARPSCVWDEVSEIPFDQNRFLDAFTIQAAPPSSSSSSSRKSSSSSSKKSSHKKSSGSSSSSSSSSSSKKEKEKEEVAGFGIGLFDPGREEDFKELMINLPPVKLLRKAVESLDEAILSKENIVFLIERSPTDEELEAIHEAVEKGVNISKQDTYIGALHGITRIRDRLTCWLFTRTFQQPLIELEDEIQILSEAFFELKESPRLKGCLSVILSFGNFMNAGSSRGQADGFKVEALEVVIDVRDTKNSQSLLEFLVHVLQETNPDALQIKNDFECLPGASELELSASEQTLKDLWAEYNEIKKMSKIFTDQPFKKHFEPLLNDARQTLVMLNQRMKEAKQRFHETVEYFAPNLPKYVREMTSKRFLGVFVDFIEALDQEQQRLKQRSADRGKRLFETSSSVESDPLSALINNIRMGNIPKA